MRLLKWRGFRKYSYGADNRDWVCQNFGTDDGCRSGPTSDGVCMTGNCKPRRTSMAKRGLFSYWTGALALSIIIILLTLSSGNRFLMPGPLTSTHRAIENCTGCHKGVSDGHFGWMGAVLRAATPGKDSKACLSCHKMTRNALNPHGHGLNELNDMSRKALNSTEVSTSDLTSAVGRTIFPVGARYSDGIHCSTCHREHQGSGADLKLVSNARCQACHQKQFNSLRNGHPVFKKYPAKQRTHINFDHNSHFNKHIPKLIAEGDRTKTIPKHCTGCHAANPGDGQMAVKPFAEICSSCHLNQILGTERASGPKGIAFLTLPGLDVASLRKKGADIGKWPEGSEAEITPFMKFLMGSSDEVGKLLAYVEELDLLDLENASRKDISNVEGLVWQIKLLIQAISTSGVSGPLSKAIFASAKKSDPSWLGRLSAALPRDVLISARREWLADLEPELKKHKRRLQAKLNTPLKKSTGRPPPIVKKINPRLGKIKNRGRGTTNAGEWRINELGELIKGDEEPAHSEGSADEETVPDDQGGEGTVQKEGGKTGDKDLDAEGKREGKQNDDAPPVAEKNKEEIKDAESWAEFGGWYRQDYSIYYLPQGHADGFLRAWLDFTAGRDKNDASNPGASIFAQLTDKDAQGQCVKCHSVEADQDGRLSVKWQPMRAEMKKGRFTSFSHLPHIGLTDKRGCLTCHEMDRDAKSQATYKGHNADVFSPNFKQITRKKCLSCHSPGMVRDDCQLCHKYHVNGVASPTMTTTLPGK